MEMVLEPEVVMAVPEFETVMPVPEVRVTEVTVPVLEVLLFQDAMFAAVMPAAADDEKTGSLSFVM